ncbi:gamma-aminobutyric acid type B receptor subunit 3 isoform X6 [Lasioglossum baleicum]|uniref:gamma-aminobutyric acid type B receptor subunit 3 isoform X6 n=1 Tax=Lasioglossum baleicum TaxID=434251 RepID=UPI003FCD287E
MTRVRTRRDLSRLLLPFSPFNTLHLPRSLVLFLFVLVSVNSVLPCTEDTKPESRDLISKPCLNIAKKGDPQPDPEDLQSWTQLSVSREQDHPGSDTEDHPGPNLDDQSGPDTEDQSETRIEDRSGSRSEDHPGPDLDDQPGPDTEDQSESRIEDRSGPRSEDHPGPDTEDHPGPDTEDRSAPRLEDQSKTHRSLHNNHASQRSSQISIPGSLKDPRDHVPYSLEDSSETKLTVEASISHSESRRRHERRKSRSSRLDDALTSPNVDISSSSKEYIEPRRKRNFRNGKLGAKGTPKSTDLDDPVSDCEECDGEVLESTESSDRITESPRSSENNQTVDATSSPEVDSDLPASSSNGSNEEPFTGFEGSQKFPIKVTYKPAVIPQVEKFDRRHFGPPKLEATETTLEASPTTLSPDLPKSAGKDVLHRHRKVDEITEEERRQETIDAIENANDTDDLWLPGASSGRRSSNIAAGKPANEEKRITIATTSIPASTTSVDDDERIEESTISSTRFGEKINVTILGLFEMTRGADPRPEGPSELQAARMAVEHVNAKNVLSRFRLRLVDNDTKAWKLGMHGGDYAWILPGDTIDLSAILGDWWQTAPEECTHSQLSQALNGLITVKSHGSAIGNEISPSGLTSSKFTAELARRGVTVSKFAAQTYDAVWAMAKGLEKTEALLNKENASIAQYTHKRKDIATRLLDQMRLLRFIGVSGPVSFDGADRVGITSFFQMYDHVVRRIAVFRPEDGKLIMNCPGCATTKWPGGQPPAARRVFRLRVVTVAPAAFLVVTCIASVGVTLALAFLAFNLHFRRHKSIKLSSPRLNNMAAVGCGLVYGAVILLGLDHATLPDSDDYYPAVCTARVYLLSAGFSLAFGSMFTKTYRVHRIFTKSRSGVVKDKLLQDTRLISLICVLLLIDGLVVTLWVTFDPMQRHLRNLTLEINPQDRGVVYQPQVEVCHSQHTNSWLGALYVYKGLLLIVGVYMAWETRHVKIPALNDSQYIGMSVYFVVITSGIVVVLANLMSDRATLAFVTITALILASTTATLALLFLPQLANILAGERADPVVQSLGLKIECNTRRFVTDDKNELQYRVEVQNRVYRREMAQLELELARLEKQLAQEPVEPSHASSSTSIPQRNPSISGGLPLLLLSVLPPVIPRASWPSANPSGMRRGTVAFSSQPDLEPDGPRRSLADIYKLNRRRETEGPNRLGVFQRLFSLFGSRPSSRKTSTASFTGVASALRVHMGYIAGLVPGTKAASTCQVNAQGTRPPHPRCGSGPIISITSEEDRRLSLGLRRKESSEPRVNFSLPPKASTSQSSSREKIRGSPRFPHRIVPANSLNAIASGSSISKSQRWHSMEDARKTKPLQTPRGSSCSPNCDVWATREVEIPLSELGIGTKKPPDSLALPFPVESKAKSPDDRLGNDPGKLPRANDVPGIASPAESETKPARLASSASSSPVNARISEEVNVESNIELDTSTNFARDDPWLHSRPNSPIVHVTNVDEMETRDVDKEVN